MTAAQARIDTYRAARERVLDRIADACARVRRDPAEVTLVAVSKTVPAEAVRDAVAAGLDTLGENRVQEGVAKAAEVPGAHWHLVGPLQSNKARRALETFELIQTVDSGDLARRLDRLAPEIRPEARYPILVQVNVDRDPAKAGFPPAEADDAVASALRAYRSKMRHYAGASQMEIWYDSIYVEQLLGYFGEALSAAKCGNCDNCLSPPQLRDGKVIAQKLLSCAYRTGQRFGAMHLIDVLVGRMTERVKQFGHDKLSVFGIGRELNEKQWRAALRQLVAMGHLAPDSEAFGALKLTETARGVLKGETEVMLREQAPGSHTRATRAKSRRGDIALRPAGQGETVNATLLGALRTWRSAMARQRGVPAYVVLHDATIEGIATARPTTLAQLRGIPGIGDKKLEHYGDELLALVKRTEA